MEPINLKDCIGYLWWSDQEDPEICNGKEKDLCLDEAKNPFVVEGQLYDKVEKKSYSIKYVDGQYHINIFNVEANDLDNPDNEKKCYLSNRMGGKWVKFLRYWEEEEDPDCEGMKVLKLTKNVFIGFKEQEDSL